MPRERYARTEGATPLALCKKCDACVPHCTILEHVRYVGIVPKGGLASNLLHMLLNNRTLNSSGEYRVRVWHSWAQIRATTFATTMTAW